MAAGMQDHWAVRPVTHWVTVASSDIIEPFQRLAESITAAGRWLVERAEKLLPLHVRLLRRLHRIQRDRRPSPRFSDGREPEPLLGRRFHSRMRIHRLYRPRGPPEMTPCNAGYWF
jgi:hypothetical protein